MIIYRLTHQPVICIFGISLIVNFLVLPIYNRADEVQNEERKKQDSMAKWVNHIKKSFKGDERMMMLQTYYRQQEYKPIYAVRSSISVLLQIPFFIAAYHFLSNLDLLVHTSFGPINDLSMPDGLIHVSGICINLLPVLMTVINILSGLIYSKGLSKKEVIQIPVLAIVFLVLLYKSPSGLVLYWTLNNIFSLFKNVFKKYIKNPGLVLSFFLLLSGGVLSFALLKKYWSVATKFRILGIGLLLLSSLPLIACIFSRKSNYIKNLDSERGIEFRRIYFSSSIILIVLIGILIPSSVIVPSPSEFVDYGVDVMPLHYVFKTFLLACGFFGIWSSVFYYLGKPSTRTVISAIMSMLAYCSVINFMIFGNDLGNINADMVFDHVPEFTNMQAIKNLVILGTFSVILFAILKKKTKWIWNLSIIVALSLFVLSVKNIIGIQKNLSDYTCLLTSNSESGDEDAFGQDNYLFSLSTEAENTVLIMLDRAISAYIPYMLEEKPELKEQFSDFIYYPNAISLGRNTIASTPSLFGGYDYLPEALAERTNETYSYVHNEALKVLPIIFYENGYNVTVCDAPYAGYQWIPDLSIYDDYPEINTYITKGRYSQAYTQEPPEENVRRRERSMFCYGVFKCIPIGLQTVFYDSGYYWSSDSSNAQFVNQYSTLAYLSDLTGINNISSGSFFMIDNDTAHEPCELQLPDYIPARRVDNTGLESGERVLSDGSSFVIDEAFHYHANMAALIQIGKWLDYLKESGVYDNTRIIIVSDHGSNLGQFEYMMIELDDDTIDIEAYNPLFLYKDINVSGTHNPISTSDKFITLADVPALMTEGLIDNPINPFTGNALRRISEEERVGVLINSAWDSSDADELISGQNMELYSVGNDIFDSANWSKETSK